MPAGGTESVIAQQTMLYGEPLSTRFGRVLQAYAIPQSRLAAVIGLSAPMLSQLASGQRVKISNPAVLARLLRLEELADSPAVRSGDAERRRAALDEVAGSRPQLTTGLRAVDRTDVVDVLATLASSTQLATAAAAVASTPLAALLQDAAGRTSQGADS